MSEPQSAKSLKRSVSFEKKMSMIKVDEATGQSLRPNISRIYSDENMTQKVYDLMSSYIPRDISTIKRQIVNHVEYTLARTRFDFKSLHCFQAASHSVRDRLIQYFNDTNRCINISGKKKVYYLSLQFLIGRCFQNAIVNLDLEEQYQKALQELGYSLERIRQKQVDPALGNGGLGRLAACFLDSLASLNYPSWGYGIRYEYGIFRQVIQNGHQIQIPDYWLNCGNPWEIERVDVQYTVSFYGHTRHVKDAHGKQIVYWDGTQNVLARAYDNPIPGYATFNTIGLRLWKSFPINQFDFSSFNSGEYYKALQNRQKAEYITSVLYPNDSTQQGKQLRLKQQYLLVSATIQDIIRRHKKNAEIRKQKFQWKNFPKEASIQLNDTHPALGIVELLRILVDKENIDYHLAWQIVYDTFSYTNHTVLPQALEKWSVQLLGRLLPRHLQLIYLINHIWLDKISKKLPEQKRYQKLNTLSLVQQSQPKRIRMANLCVIGSHKVNGVAKLHSQLLKQTIFSDFYKIFPHKFINVTNGVTTRRWILCANPRLASLYTQYLGSDQWIMNMSELRKLQKFIGDEQFENKWMKIKHLNKRRLKQWILKTNNIDINIDSLFDVQIKRIHEYKRQFMNILYVIYRYLTLKQMPPQLRTQAVPRTVIFAGKAAPAYQMAKKIIKLIHEVSYVINNDKVTNNLLKVVFIPNYNVTNAEVIIPATEISQHISTAGTQASGTSNMKFVLNGGLIIGTMDGANVEIYDQVGKQNIFIFGAKVQEIEGLRHKMSQTDPQQYLPNSLKKVIRAIEEGMFGQKDLLMSLVHTITHRNDRYLLGADFDSYIECQNKVDEAYKDQKEWNKMSILNAVRSGIFSSDRTIRQYAEKVWNLQPVKVILDEAFDKKNNQS